MWFCVRLSIPDCHWSQRCKSRTSPDSKLIRPACRPVDCQCCLPNHDTFKQLRIFRVRPAGLPAGRLLPTQDPNHDTLKRFGVFQLNFQVPPAGLPAGRLLPTPWQWQCHHCHEVQKNFSIRTACHVASFHSRCRLRTRLPFSRCWRRPSFGRPALAGRPVKLVNN